MAKKTKNWKELKLVVTKGEKKGEEYNLDRPTTGIGRSPLNQIVLNDEGVSPFHARVIVEGKMCIITDMGAHEGLRVNSKKVETTGLVPGDSIEIGQTLLEVTINIDGQKAAPRKKGVQRKKRIKFHIPVRLSILIILLIVFLVAIVILDLHWLNQLLNWE